MPASLSTKGAIWLVMFRRLLSAAAVLLGAVSVVFFLFALVPADVTTELLGLQSSAEARAQLGRELGLDRPLVTRYLLYLGRLSHGDLGRSLAGLGEVRPLVAERLRATLPLIFASACLALVAGLTLAAVIAWINRPGVYRLADAMALALASVPAFVSALALMILFGQGITLPVIYEGTLRSAILPVAVLALAPTFWVARLVSADLRRVLARDFILFRRALGFSDGALLATAFRNVSLITTIGTNVLLAVLLGTFFVEYAFNWPGFGQLLVYSIVRRDVPVVQGVVLCFAAIILTVEWSAETTRMLREPAR